MCRIYSPIGELLSPGVHDLAGALVDALDASVRFRFSWAHSLRSEQQYLGRIDLPEKHALLLKQMK
jgi:hypothetical protein